MNNTYSYPDNPHCETCQNQFECVSVTGDCTENKTYKLFDLTFDSYEQAEQKVMACVLPSPSPSHPISQEELNMFMGKINITGGCP